MPEALVAYENAVKLDPKFKEAYVNLAQLHREAGKGDDAIRVFKRAIKLDAKYMHAAHLYGLCLHGMGRTREALAQFHTALKIEPSHAACIQVRPTVQIDYRLLYFSTASSTHLRHRPYQIHQPAPTPTNPPPHLPVRWPLLPESRPVRASR